MKIYPILILSRGPSSENWVKRGRLTKSSLENVPRFVFFRESIQEENKQLLYLLLIFSLRWFSYRGIAIAKIIFMKTSSAVYLFHESKWKTFSTFSFHFQIYFVIEINFRLHYIVVSYEAINWRLLALPCFISLLRCSTSLMKISIAKQLRS